MKIYQYLARLGWFLLKALLAMGLITGGLTMVYHIASNSANVYVIATDGLKMRAATALAPNTVNPGLDLSMYFTDTYLAQDDLLLHNPYEGAEVTDYVYHLRVKEIWCRPWDGIAHLVVEESIPSIDGYFLGESVEGDNVQRLPLPPWPHNKYRITCRLIGGIWMVDEMQLIEELAPEPTPTDEPKVTLPPPAEPTPAVEAAPSPASTPAETLPPIPVIE